MRTTLSLITTFIAAVEPQKVYITTTGYTDRPQCTQLTASPYYRLQPFSYTLQETVR